MVRMSKNWFLPIVFFALGVFTIAVGTLITYQLLYGHRVVTRKD